jgi:hypothetical protein
MATRKHNLEEIVAKLRKIDALTSQGWPIAKAMRSDCVTEAVYRGWRSEHDGLLRTLGASRKSASKKSKVTGRRRVGSAGGISGDGGGSDADG